MARRLRFPQDKCKRGHPWTPESTYVWKGRRECRICRRRRDRKLWPKIKKNRNLKKGLTATGKERMRRQIDWETVADVVRAQKGNWVDLGLVSYSVPGQINAGRYKHLNPALFEARGKAMDPPNPKWTRLLMRYAIENKEE